jgi:hypothetical protein
MADWRTALAGVAELAGMNLPGPQSLESRQIEEFLSPAQRHHQSAPIDTRSQLGKWLADVEEGLGALVRSATDPAVAARLDQIHAALDAATLDSDFDPQSADIPLRSLRTGGAR